MIDGGEALQILVPLLDVEIQEFGEVGKQQ